MASKRAKPSRTEKTAEDQAADREVEWNEPEELPQQDLPGRTDLLFEAIRRVRAAMETEGQPSRTTVANLVQLLKLHKELMEDEKVPTEVHLVWEETEEELFAES